MKILYAETPSTIIDPYTYTSEHNMMTELRHRIHNRLTRIRDNIAVRELSQSEWFMNNFINRLKTI